MKTKLAILAKVKCFNAAGAVITAADIDTIVKDTERQIETIADWIRDVTAAELDAIPDDRLPVRMTIDLALPPRK